MQSWIDVGTGEGKHVLIIADHASNVVPEVVDLGIDLALLSTHIAIDLGVAELTMALCERLSCRGMLGGVSRLVVDFNRDADDEALIPISSDGHVIRGNAISPADRAARIAKWWQPYHVRVAHVLEVDRPQLIVSLHSFTPQMTTNPQEARPWDIGILYNKDDRAARIAIPMLEATGACVGDQLPYSGKILNATMNRHAEANGIAYLGIEMRQDRIGDAAGVAHWADVLAPVILTCAKAMSSR